MKIAVTSDLHLGITSGGEISSMAKDLFSHEVDCLVIAGDIAESLDGFCECIKIFKYILRKQNVAISVLPGNHDIWVRDDQYNSLDILRILETKSRELGVHWLEDDNCVLGNTTIVGSYLHYDYSAKDTIGPASTLSDLYYQVNKKTVNNDGNYLVGLPEDKIFARQIGEKFIDRLERASKSNCETIIVATHVPCLEEQITRKPYDLTWSFSTAYFGNLTYQDIIKNNQKVKAVISGHSHVGVDTVFFRESGKMRVINIASDYHRPKFVVLDTNNVV